MKQTIDQISKLLQENKNPQAEQLAWELYNQNKKSFFVLKTLGVTLLVQQKFAGALSIFLQAYKIKSDDYDVLVNLAHLFIKFDEFQKTFEFANLAIEIDSDGYHPYISLAEYYLKIRDFDKAYEIAIDLQKRVTYERLSSNHQTMYLMLDIFIASNHEEDAWKFINFSHSKKFHPEIFYYQASLDPKSIDEKLVFTANQFIKESKFTNHIQKAKVLSPIYFGLGKSHLKDNQLLSDMNFIQGNEEVLQVQRFKPLENQQYIKRIKSSFVSYQPISDHSDGSELIFITGMPRSGTTLLESIITSSGEVFSCGELLSLHEIFNRVVDPEVINTLETQYLGDEESGNTYLRRVNFLNSNSNKKFILDKLPGNFNYIGFIKKRFPKAKVLYIYRDPWDNAISLYQQFYVGNIAYASSFFNIATMYANHEEIIRYWSEEAKIDFLTIKYEELVSDTQNLANTVFNYCNLSFDYDSDKRKEFFSRTASKSQVRGEVHKKSIKKSAFEQQNMEFLEYLNNQREYWKNQL